jgi:OOP family OmpA-OmpF porin
MKQKSKAEQLLRFFFEKYGREQSIMFTYDFNQWHMSEEGEKTAFQLLKTFKENNALTVLLDGYTDTWGSYSSNQRISELRVENLKNLLINKGIDPSKIEVVTHGEIIPTGGCILDYPCPLSERTQNRRVEVRLK